MEALFVGVGGVAVVFAPEGVAQTFVSYETFIAPVLLWIGVALLTVRALEAVLGRRRWIVLVNSLLGGIRVVPNFQ